MWDRSAGRCAARLRTPSISDASMVEAGELPWGEAARVAALLKAEANLPDPVSRYEHEGMREALTSPPRLVAGSQSRRGCKLPQELPPGTPIRFVRAASLDVDVRVAQRRHRLRLLIQVAAIHPSETLVRSAIGQEVRRTSSSGRPVERPLNGRTLLEVVGLTQGGLAAFRAVSLRQVSKTWPRREGRLPGDAATFVVRAVDERLPGCLSLARNDRPCLAALRIC